MNVNEFKSGYRAHLFLNQRVKKLKEDVENLYYQISGVKGIKYDRIPSSLDPRLVEQNKLDILDQIEEKLAEIKYIEAHQSYFNMILEKFSQEELDLLNRIYIKGERYEDVAQDLNYSVGGLFKVIERMIKEKLD